MYLGITNYRTLSVNVLLPPLKISNPKKAQALIVVVASTETSFVLAHIFALISLTTHKSFASAKSTASFTDIAIV